MSIGSSRLAIDLSLIMHVVRPSHTCSMVSIYIKPCRHPRCQPLSNTPVLVKVSNVGVVPNIPTPCRTHKTQACSVTHRRQAMESRSGVQMLALRHVQHHILCFVLVCYCTVVSSVCIPCMLISQPLCLMSCDLRILTPGVSLVVRWISPEYADGLTQRTECCVSNLLIWLLSNDIHCTDIEKGTGQQHGHCKHDRRLIMPGRPACMSLHVGTIRIV